MCYYSDVINKIILKRTYRRKIIRAPVKATTTFVFAHNIFHSLILLSIQGTGKTLLVKAVAHESSCVLFVCTASALTSKWHGEGEKLLKTLFQVARAAAPSIIFVDEMDALLSSRKSEGEHEASRRFKTEFMTNLDGIVKNGGGGDGNDKNGKHLLVIAATNCP